MDQLGHTDPTFTLRVYRHGMRRDPESKAQLEALIEGSEWAPSGTSSENGLPDADLTPVAGNTKPPR
jgi:hypothetical protein